MFRNINGDRFEDVTGSVDSGTCRGRRRFADIDDDGDQDIFHQVGGFYPGDAFHNVLFESDMAIAITIRLEGTTSNRDGNGARIKVVTGNNGELAELHQAVGSVSGFGGSPSSTSAWARPRNQTNRSHLARVDGADHRRRP